LLLEAEETSQIHHVAPLKCMSPPLQNSVWSWPWLLASDLENPFSSHRCRSGHRCKKTFFTFFILVTILRFL